MKNLAHALHLEGFRCDDDLQVLVDFPKAQQTKILDHIRETRNLCLKDCLLLRCELEARRRDMVA